MVPLTWILMENPSGCPRLHKSAVERLCARVRISTKKEKRSKKERKKGLWKLTRCGNAGKSKSQSNFPPFPQRLENSPQKALRVSHQFPQARRRRRSTLRRAIFCPKNGEPPCLLLNFKCP